MTGAKLFGAELTGAKLFGAELTGTKLFGAKLLGTKLMGAELSVLYRGDLSSCNYDCSYCPFAKRVDSAAVTALDRASLMRFVDWCQHSTLRLRILFTPWGEALVRKHYREAFVRASHMTNVIELGIQTNLSRAPSWLAQARAANISLWCTYHPSQTTRPRFLHRIQQLQTMGIGFSVGMVALREDLNEIQAMRHDLDDLAHSGKAIYLWLNAYDGRSAGYYSAADIQMLTAIDPHFAYNNQPMTSFAADCRAGHTAISVNAAGDVRPCHFVPRVLGNLYDGSFERALAPTPCPNRVCDCYIGYALRKDLAFQAPLTRGFAP
jgi:hypothetical protein